MNEIFDAMKHLQLLVGIAIDKAVVECRPCDDLEEIYQQASDITLMLLRLETEIQTTKR